MKRWIFAVSLFVTGCAATISGRPPGAQQVVAQMQAACGGSAWDRVAGWHETGVAELWNGRTIQNEVWHDMWSLKTRMVGRMNGSVVRDFGFDGAQYWQVGPDGKSQIGSDAAVLRRHRRDAYLSSFGWFFPHRFPAEIEVAPAQTLNGRSFQVLRIRPRDADTFDLWIDPQTHLVHRIVAGAEFADLSAYRTFDGVCTATKGRQGDADPTHEIVLHVQTVDTAHAISPSVFEPPAR